MKRRTKLDSIEDTITTLEWKDKIACWPESTSTSTSGFHLTHSKALLGCEHRHLVLIDATMLKSAQYLLKTIFGMSSTSHHHCDFFPIHGSGQGSGNSPGLWCCISSTLFNVYESKAHGAYFQSPCGTISTKVL